MMQRTHMARYLVSEGVIFFLAVHWRNNFIPRNFTNYSPFSPKFFSLYIIHALFDVQKKLYFSIPVKFNMFLVFFGGTQFHFIEC